MFKYVYKGYDCICFNISENRLNDEEIVHDEINQHVDAQYVSAPEGMWRLLEFRMYDKSHAIIVSQYMTRADHSSHRVLRIESK